MSREQADRVALSNDTNPFDNEVWVKNMISTGAIVPPPGDMRRNDRLAHIYIFGFLIAGGLFFWMGMGFK